MFVPVLIVYDHIYLGFKYFIFDNLLTKSRKIAAMTKEQFLMAFAQNKVLNDALQLSNKL